MNTNTLSLNNSTTTILTGASTFTGVSEQSLPYEGIQVSIAVSAAGTLYVDFSFDNTNWDLSESFTVTSGNSLFKVSNQGKYFRVRYVNGASAQTYFRLYTMIGRFTSNSGVDLGADISDSTNAIVTKSIMTGRSDAGHYQSLALTNEGHAEVAIHAPRLPFGAVHAESIYPVFQSDAVYGIRANLVQTTTSGSGTATTNDSNFVTSTGTTIYSFGAIQSRKRLRYRSGQGVIGRFSAIFSNAVASSILVAGFGHAEDGVYIGYNGTSFGILYSRRGVREIQTLTLSAASSTSENITITLGGIANSVAVTNSANLNRTAWEISQGTFTGWNAEAVGSTVVFVKGSVGNATGTFSLSGSTAAGTFAETLAGAAATETWITQSEWNGDKLDGTGTSGVTINPQKYNVFQIGIQYLGAGSIVFQSEVCSEDGNNPDFVVLHTMKLPNTLTTTSFGNPSFPFTMAAYSAGSTTDVSVKSGSFAGFIEGQKHLHGTRFTYTGQSTGIGSGSYGALFSIRNSRVFASRSNQSVIELLSVSCAIKHTSPVTLYLIRNGSLVGNPNFTSYSTESCVYSDTTATAVSFSNNSQVIWSGQLGDTGNFLFPFDDEVTLQPGEMLTVAAKSSTGTPSYVLATLNTREDQ